MKTALPLALFFLAACNSKKDPTPAPKADEEVVMVSVTGMT